MLPAQVLHFLATILTALLVALHLINPTAQPSVEQLTPTPEATEAPTPSTTLTMTPTPSVKPKISITPTPKPTAAPVTINNTPPGAGYRRQSVQTDVGTFSVDIIAADLGSTKIIVDTASDSSCTNECPTLPLSDYVSRNGAFAGMNGAYFCPESYSQCAGKTNSFDTLLMNKNKVYFNSDNNVYSNVPAVIFSGGSIRFIMHSSEWGRDTGIDSMIANYPMLVFNNEAVGYSTEDVKLTLRGPRSFVANKGSIVYIGFVNGANIAEAAKVMSTMGMENAIHMDDGGSSALWYGGYKKGPGRNIPSAILFVSR